MQRNWLKIILLAPTLTAGVGTLLYHFFKWSAPPAIIGLIFSLGIAWFFSQTKASQATLPPNNKLSAFFSFLITGLVGLGLIYLIRHSAGSWLASPWQIVSKYFFLLVGGLFILLFWALIKNLIRPWALAAATFFFWSINSFIFKNGYGFDVFVHTATVRAWIANGAIQPTTFLYNGYHTLIAAANALTKIDLLSLMQFGVPLLGALIVAAAFQQLRHNSTYQKIAPFFVIGVLIFSQSLFTTATPQTLAHFLLLGLIIELLCSPPGRSSIILNFLIAVGIATIHPLSGIVAITFVAWHTRLPKILVWLGAATLPILSLLFSANATISFPPLNIAKEFFGIQPQSFQPTSIDHLIYLAHLFVPLIGLICLLAATKHEKNRHRSTLLFGGALLLSSSTLLFVSLPAVASYERVDFSRRVFLAAWLVVLPAVAAGAQIIFSSTKPAARRLISILTIFILFSAWYWSYSPHNSIRISKAVNVSPLDTTIVQSIDARAAGQPYVVLADQVTSAAALANFGFLERRLPNRNFYFYPIPTGDRLYQEFFLPAMSQGVTKETLRNAADYANAPLVFIVIKPYWEPAPTVIESVKQNTATWNVDGVLLGQFVR